MQSNNERRDDRLGVGPGNRQQQAEQGYRILPFELVTMALILLLFTMWRGHIMQTIQNVGEAKPE